MIIFITYAFLQSTADKNNKLRWNATLFYFIDPSSFISETCFFVSKIYALIFFEEFFVFFFIIK